MRHVRLVVPLLLILACGTEPSEPPSSFIRFRTDGSDYMQSDPFTITITNVGSYRLRVQPRCFELQQLTDNGWKMAGGAAETPTCTWVTLSPGQNYFQPFSIRDAPLGTARIEFLEVQILDSTGTGGAIPQLPVGERRTNQFRVTQGNTF